MNSSIDTQVDEQIKRLDNLSDEVDEDSNNDARKLMASYVRKQVLLGKAFAAFVKS